MEISAVNLFSATQVSVKHIVFSYFEQGAKANLVCSRNDDFLAWPVSPLINKAGQELEEE